MKSMNSWGSKEFPEINQESRKFYEFMENIGRTNNFYELMIFSKEYLEIMTGKIIQYDLFLRLLIENI